MIIKSINNRGRKGLIGSVSTEVDSLAFFAGYNDCERCGTRNKVLLDMTDVRSLSKKLGYHREPVGARLARRIIRYYELP